MKKLYRVRLMDMEDGGHVLDEVFFEQAKNARDEFLKVKKQIFDRYHYDQYAEFSWHVDDHFRRYRSSDYEVTLSTIETEKHIECFNTSAVNDNPPLPLLFDDPNDICTLSVDGVFNYAIKQISHWNYEHGFKCVYDNVNRVLGYAITKCTYDKEDRPWYPATMTYFINTSDHGKAIVEVQKDNPKEQYSYSVTYEY